MFVLYLKYKVFKRFLETIIFVLVFYEFILVDSCTCGDSIMITYIRLRVESKNEQF